MMSKEITLTIEELDNFLLKLLNADKVGIRRKLIAMKNFLEENTILLNQNKPLPPPPPKDREIHISGKSRNKR